MKMLCSYNLKAGCLTKMRDIQIELEEQKHLVAKLRFKNVWSILLNNLRYTRKVIQHTQTEF